MTIMIIGLGLIGGSIGIELSKQLGVKTIGYDHHPDHMSRALERNLVHRCGEWQEEITQADLIIVATPVSVIEELLPKVLDRCKGHQVVVDVGSTKEHITQKVLHHPQRRRYVAAHPLAGTEHSGPEAAIRGLFSGKKNIICNADQSDPDAVEQALALFRSLGMESHLMSAADHDQHLAFVSHLSHATSFALGLTVLDLEEDMERIMQLAGTGFASTARLAKSHPDTWEAIFSKNARPLTHAIDAYIKHLSQLRDAIASNDAATIKQLIRKANTLTPYI